MPNSRIVDLDLKPKPARAACLAALNETYLWVSWYYDEPSYDRIEGKGRWRGFDTLFDFKIDFRVLKGGLVSLRLWTNSNLDGPIDSLQASILQQQEKLLDAYDAKTPAEQQAMLREVFDGVVFLSYARRDFKFADKLRRDLFRCDLEVWLDQDYLRTGQKWPAEIETAIAKADVFVLVIAPDGEPSKWIEKELSHAVTGDKPIFPVVHSETAIPKWLEPYVGNIETADLTKSNYGRGFNELLDALKARMPAASS